MSFEQNMLIGDRVTDRLTDSMVRNQLVPAYRESLKNIKGDIAHLYEQHSKLGKLELADIRKYNRLKNLEEKIASEMGRLRDKQVRITSKSITGAYREAYARSAYALDMEARVRLGFGMLPKKQVEAALVNPMDRIGWKDRTLQEAKAATRRIREEITRGIALGKGYPEVARNVSEKLGISAGRAELIVKTEAHRAREEGKLVSYEHAAKRGVDMEKVWTATLDDKTRNSHQGLDGQAVPVIDDEGNPGKFVSPSGATAEYPGGFGIAEEDIRCRCSHRGQIRGYPPEMRRARDEGPIPYQTYADYAKSKGWPQVYKGPEPGVAGLVGPAVMEPPVTETVERLVWDDGPPLKDAKNELWGFNQNEGVRSARQALDDANMHNTFIFVQRDSQGIITSIGSIIDKGDFYKLKHIGSTGHSVGAGTRLIKTISEYAVQNNKGLMLEVGSRHRGYFEHLGFNFKKVSDRTFEFRMTASELKEWLLKSPDLGKIKDYIGEIKGLKELGGGAADTFVGEVGGKKFVFKSDAPIDTLDMLDGNIEGELLGAKVLKMNGLPAPNCQYGTFKLPDGSTRKFLQFDFVDDAAPIGEFLSSQLDKLDYDKLRRMQVVDVLIGNGDRHGGNIMIRRATQELIPIDHNLAFATDRTISPQVTWQKCFLKSASSSREQSPLHIMTRNRWGSDAMIVGGRYGTGKEAFTQYYVSHINSVQKTMTDDVIKSLVDNLPRRVGVERRQEIHEILIWRRDNLHNLIQSTTQKF